MDPSYSSNINKRAETAEKTYKVFQQKTGSLAGHIYSFYAGTEGVMYGWAKEHIVATVHLEQAVIALERAGEDVSPHIYKTLEACQQGVVDLAKWVDRSQFLKLIFKKESDISSEGLLKGKGAIAPEEREWHLNLGLLMNAYKQTNDPTLKKELSFLAIQYLAKAAPLDEGSKIPFESHKGFFIGQTYHREFSIFEKYLLPQIQKSFVPGSQTGSFLVDTKECGELLPVFYSVIPSSEGEESWGAKIIESVSTYIEKGDFAQFMEPPLLFDFTDEIGDLSLESKEGFDKKIKELEAKIERAIDRAATQIQNNSTLTLEELKSVIRANTTCISRHEVGGVAVVRILPILVKEPLFEALSERDKTAGSNPAEVIYGRSFLLEVFLNRTGTRLGAVRARGALFEHMSLEELLKAEGKYSLRELTPVQYLPKGENILYYPTQGALLNTALMTRFEKNLGKYEQSHPAIAIQGGGTLSLFKGLMSEISEKEWEELNGHPEIRMVFQATLFRFMQHLARAENNMHEADTSPKARVAFASSMELAQAEISTLLTIISPFQEEDFEKIYKGQLTHIPENLRGSLAVGVGKSAMNVFAGVNQAVAHTTGGAKPQRVISEGSYFEEVSVIGAQHTPENLVNDTYISKVDLYVGEFNHNVNINPSVSHYDLVDIAAEIDQLLRFKPKTDRLTIAIDQTIDFVRSANVQDLLENYEEQIEEGRLNFVFFRSGQKFDMFGMDHYYGSPFYMVNNGDAHWNPFKALTTEPVFKTDSLSMQWFCLANKYGFERMEDYRNAIFKNTRTVLAQVPEPLKEGNNSEVRVSSVGEGMSPAFIDIKFIGKKEPNATEMADELRKKFIQNKQPIHERSSFGFPHTNITIISDEKGKPRTLRINPGLDPFDAQLITEFLDELAIEVA